MMSTDETTPEHLRFRFGSYSTPTFKYGEVVQDERHGDVRIVGTTDTPMPWPTGKRLGESSSKPFIILFDSLADAVRNESNQTVCHWWRVTSQTVTKWRKALEVVRTNGDRQRSHEVAEIGYASGGKDGMLAMSQDSGRRRKIADSRRGKKRPRHVIETLRKANLRRTPSDESRQRMSDSHKRRGTKPPAAGETWTADEDSLLTTLSPHEAALSTSRTLTAVYSRRSELGLGDGRKAAAAIRQARLYDHCRDILPEIQRLRQSGKTLRWLATWLDSSGVENGLGKRWTHNQIRNLLNWARGNE